MFKKRNQFNQLPELGYSYANPSVSVSRSKRLLRIFIVVALIAIVGLVALMVRQKFANNPKSVAQTFLVATSKGEVDKSYKMTSKSFGLSLSKNEWSKKVDIYHVLFTKDVRHVSSESKSDEEGQKYNKEVFQIGGDEVNYRVEVDVSMNDEKWLVNRMNVEEAQ